MGQLDPGRGLYSAMVGTVTVRSGFWAFLVRCLFCAPLQKEPGPLLPGYVYSTKITTGNVFVWPEGWSREGIS